MPSPREAILESNASQPAIELAGVTVTRGDTDILCGVDWVLRRGESCAILGPNGSGKTTMIRAITGFMWPRTGSVTVLGRKLGRTDVRELRRHVMVVDPSERFGVDSNLTAHEAVLTGFFATIGLYDEVTDEQRDRAENLLKTVGLGHRLDHKVGTLSTGEKRRCLIARSLVKLPEVLILDEPTAGLDIAGREHVLATVEQLRTEHPQMAVVMVTHHVEEISPKTDEVLVMKEGRISARGKPEDVVTPEVLSEAFGCKVFVQKRSGRWWLEVLPEAWLDLLAGEPRS